MALAAADSETVTLRDGGSVSIRPIRPDDKERLLGHFSRLGPESVHHRFFGMKKTLSPEELRGFTELDFVERAALLATVEEGACERIVGVGRYARCAAIGARRAEVAFAVEDAFQGRGIATALLARLIPLARGNALEALEADVLADNTPMLRAFARAGFERLGTEAGVVRVRLPLGRG